MLRPNDEGRKREVTYFWRCLLENLPFLWTQQQVEVEGRLTAVPVQSAVRGVFSPPRLSGDVGTGERGSK